MCSDHDYKSGDQTIFDASRRELLQGTVASLATLAAPRNLFGSALTRDGSVDIDKRFPYFKSKPVSYLNVTMRDTFWASRQMRLNQRSVPWATKHFDEAGGVDALKLHSGHYTARIQSGDLEAIKFTEAMAAVVGLQRDASIEGLIRAWGKEMIVAQTMDGYWTFGWPSATDPAKRWRAVWW
jgi:hypothetical protein